MILSKAQESALNAMLAGRNVFLTGSAGTGKSTVINEFKKQTAKKVVVVAPTGVAALNIGGQTIHSFFMLPIGLITKDNIEEIKFARKKQMLRMIDTIIIDEISMVRSDIFAAIDIRCKQVAVGKNKHKPFGGKQIICSGDFYQLSPIIGSSFEEDWLNEHMNGEYAFETTIWENCEFDNHILKESFRQKDDVQFLSILENVRAGTHNKECIEVDNSNLSALDALNKLCAFEKKMQHYPVRLCTTNREVQSINDQARAKINNPTVNFNAIVSGNFNEDEYPTEGVLQLKVGLRVMLLCNKRKPNGEFLYVNGDCGEIVEIRPNSFESKVGIMLDKGYKVYVSCHEWQKTKYVMDKDHFTGRTIIRQEITGTFTQVPLRLAYAITVHKAQGMTLDCVDFRLGNGCFAHGQLYTALSRAKTSNGLQIERNIVNDDLILDDRVIDFYKKLEEPNSVDEMLMRIPKAHQDKVAELLKQLKAENY